MEYIHRLPFILGASMSIIVGLLSYESQVEQSEAFLRMAISMLIFFVIGMFLRNILVSSIEEVEKKRDELEKKKAEDEKLEMNKARKNEENPPSTIDYRAIGDGEDFEPMTVSQVIKRKIDNN